MSGRVEMNPGEMFLIADRTILVDEYESILGDVSKIGSSESRLAYLITFSGKVNNLEERDSVTVAMTPKEAWDLVGDLLNGLEIIAKAKGGGD